MALTIIAILCDALNYYFEGKAVYDTPHMVVLCLSLLLINFIEAGVGVYINCYINEHKKSGIPFTYKFSFITCIVEACCFILTLILVVTQQVFILDNGHQIKGNLYIIPFSLDATASIFIISYVISHSQYISVKGAITILTVAIFTAAGYLLDGLMPGYNFSVMFGLAAILLNYLLVKEREILDIKTDEEIRFRKRVQSVISLSDNFEVIFLVNLDNGTYKVARTYSDDRNMTGQDMTGNGHFIEKNRDFIMKRVHPDDREKLLNILSIAFLKDTFLKVPEYTVSYRLLEGRREVWYKLRIRPESSWPSRHKVIIGLFNNDEEYRREKYHELELEKQLARYTLIHNIIGSGSWSFFFDSSKVVYDKVYSNEIVQMFGYKPPLRPDVSYEDITHPDDLEETRKAIFDAIQDPTGKTIVELDHRMKNSDGIYHWYHSSGRILLNEDGSGELLGTNVNIDTIREKNELQKVHEKEYQFMQFRSDIFNYIATQDADTEKFLSFFEKKLLDAADCDQVVYRRADGYVLHTERRGIKLPSVRVCDSCPLYSYISAKSHVQSEFCITDRNYCPPELTLPKVCPVKSLLGRIIYNDAIPKGYIAIHFMHRQKIFNEAERNAMEEIANLLNIGLERIKLRENQQLDFERFRLVHDIVHSGMWSYHFNKNDDIYRTEYSDELYAIIGWEDKHRILTSKDFQNVIHPDDVEKASKAFDAALHDKTGKTGYNSEFRMRNQEGEYHWFRSAGRVIRYQNGYGEFFGTHINIDAEKRREELQHQLVIARNNAEAASAAKTAFLFNMSHDIRTPLNAIIGFTDMALSHKSETNKVDDYLTKVKTSSDYLLTIINDILDMSRIEAGKTQIDEKITCVTEEAEKVAQMNSIAAKEKNIQFVASIADCPHPYVLSDTVHIKQIVVNLLNNAIKYTPTGGTIWYTVHQEKAEKPDEVITHSIVQDNGIGMDPKFIEHIYEPFEREQTTTQSGIQGTGLGMSIVKRLTDLLGGEIAIDSKQGRGTTVSVSFTHKIATPEQIEEFKAAKKLHEEADLGIDEEKLIGKRLLLVEDNELNREISEQILQERGLIIETAVNGLIALDTVKEKGVNYYDFILMDIQMPVMDGYTATSEIRKLPGAEKLPIAAFSANAFDEDKKRSQEAGMNIHVAKPINIKELTRALASLL
ncbi:MAG: PAS domain-containing protein [Treponema sp.]|nr:PAS domain-containing protein [Candidatus Treponema caballi]